MPDKIEICIKIPNKQKHAKQDFTYLTEFNGVLFI